MVAVFLILGLLGMEDFFGILMGDGFVHGFFGAIGVADTIEG